MQSRLSYLLATVLISTIPAAGHSRTDESVAVFTIQVGSFPDSSVAEMYAARLASAGEKPLCDKVGIEGHGQWTRVFIGIFDSPQAAKQYGDALRSRGVITEFFVKRASPSLALTRPRRVIFKESRNQTTTESAPAKLESTLPQARRILNLPFFRLPSGSRKSGIANRRGSTITSNFDTGNVVLPIQERTPLSLIPAIDSSLIPRPDPIALVFRLVTSNQRSGRSTADHRTGLWISGDTAEALSRLRWIVGPENAEILTVDSDGRVILDKSLLSKAAGIGESNVQDPVKALDYITSNEGLLLLVQISEGRYAYLFHIGRQAPTSGRPIETTGSINLDNNVDSRINPYRRNGKKLDEERPPRGFDSLIGLNPVARWFNLSTNSWVQGGEIVFHELAEAHAKLEYGLDYLDQGVLPGAHATALRREERLKSQRPDEDIVITIGSNRLLRTEHEIRLFYAESSQINQR